MHQVLLKTRYWCGIVLYVLLLYDERTKYSINTIYASIDGLRDVHVHLVSNLDELLLTAVNLKEKNQRVVAAVSLLTTMLADENYLEKLASTIRILKSKNCIVICGGPHASGDPLGTVHALGFDYAVIGEGEETIKDFVIALRDGKDVKSVKGLAYVEEGKFVYTGRRKPVNLDEHHPFPYWRGLFNPIEVTRGCPYGCFYCQVSYIHGFAYRHRSVNRVVFYATEFFKSGRRDLRFITPNGFAYGLTSASRTPNIHALEELLDSLWRIASRYGGRIFLGTFPSEVRPEHVTEETLGLLKKYVSNNSIIIGAQSASERILRSIHRGHSVEDVLNAVELCRNYGFTPDIDLILGFPGETRDEMKLTLEFAEKIAEKGGRVHLHYYIPLPGTPLGLRPPERLPETIVKRLMKLIGKGKAYGDWLKQMEISWNIIELHKKGMVYPRSTAPGFIS